MNTIVMNLSTLAVTEYTPALNGVSGEFEAATDGIYKLGGTESVAATLTTGKMLSDARQRPRCAYVAGMGLDDAATLTMTVSDSSGAAFSYADSRIHDNVARFDLGRGLRDNYLGLSLYLVSTVETVIDDIDFIKATSPSRRAF